MANGLISALKSADPKLTISMAPQMPNLNYQVTSVVEAGVNALVPVVSASIDSLDYVMPQMYNTWGAVETAQFAIDYAGNITQPWTVSASPSGPSFDLKVRTAAAPGKVASW